MKESSGVLGLREGFEYLVELGQSRQIVKKFHDLDYSNLPWQPILPLAADPLGFSTLGSFAEFANLTNQGLEREELIVHIESPFVVSLVGKLREASRERESYATARFDQNQIFEFGKYMNAEDFIIRLQQAFDASENHRHDILALVGNMTAEKVVIANDDGVSQKVGARAGVVLQGGGAQIKNPYYLACHRTFAEITQPVSPFILRVRQNGDEVPLAALFESDNGAWKYRAMESIKTFLAAEIEDIPILA
jgi:hypothetical protein